MISGLGGSDAFLSTRLTVGVVEWSIGEGKLLDVLEWLRSKELNGRRVQVYKKS